MGLRIDNFHWTCIKSNRVGCNNWYVLFLFDFWLLIEPLYQISALLSTLLELSLFFFGHHFFLDMEFFIDLVHLIVEHFLFTYQPAFDIFDKCSLSRLEIAASVFDELMRRKNFINNFYSQSIIMFYLQIVKEFLDSIIGNERKSQFYLTFFTDMKDKVFFTHNIRLWPVCIFFCDLHSNNSVSLCSYHLRSLFLG